MLKTYTRQEILSLTATRAGETKIGETIYTFGDWLTGQPAEAPGSGIRFALLGIEEDLGIRANKGIGTKAFAWEPFLSSFLGLQSNEFLKGDTCMIMGVVNGLDTVEAYDACISAVTGEILSRGWIPVVIGGGHNNAYPLMKALSLTAGKSIHCLNIDPHADLRACEGRHSGNGFSYAIAQQYLGRYAMVGLHQSYNNRFILDKLKDHDTYRAVWWEDIFLRGSYTWTQAVQQGLYFVAGTAFGVELDMDAIEHALSSAMTPVGITAQQACQALFMLGMHPDAAYLHLPEGAAEREDGLKQSTTGKLLAYLVTSFIKGKQETA